LPRPSIDKTNANAVTAEAPQLLLVDDNPTNLQVLYQTLNGHGYRLLVARNGKDAVAIAERVSPDLILLDVMMPEMNGFETCARLKGNARTRDAVVIFLSALTDPGDKVRGLDLGGVDFVTKPFQAEEVLARVRTHLRIRHLDQELRRRNAALEHELTVAQELLREARDRIDGVLIGDSAVARRLRHDIADAARSDTSLLINGPPGSDHEAVARAVHHQSARASRAIIRMSCMPALDMATAADAAADEEIPGKLALAEGGTLYLEAVQHLSLDRQRRLVDVLGTLEVRGQTTLPDVRIIMSCTGSIEEELAAGRVLPELQRRLRTIDLAPLRHRLEDLPRLAHHILKRQAEQAGRMVPQLSPDSLRRLKAYRWPGNLRELRSVLEIALATSQGQELDVGEHLLDDSVRVGSYSLLERLGSGGMGEVWLARHQLLARPAAVKLLRITTTGGEKTRTLRQRFEREALATAELQSPHTVQLYDFGVTDTGSFYYVMERLQGMDLKRMVERHGPLSPARAIFFLKQACRSLSEAHALGLVHRDIKPANLFICRLAREYDFLKVLDFGVVSRHTREPDDHVTAIGTVLGTPAFMAPELVFGEGAFDGRSDLYSLGCVGYWMLTGRPPFEATNPMAVLLHHSRTQPVAPSTVAEEPIPGDLDAVILTCLAKEPGARPATADALWDALNAIPLDDPWDRHRAREWWTQHAPELIESKK
jgi:DNA-binding NtrC family response regulator